MKSSVMKPLKMPFLRRYICFFRFAVIDKLCVGALQSVRLVVTLAIAAAAAESMVLLDG
jgi:hypothetical protein